MRLVREATPPIPPSATRGISGSLGWPRIGRFTPWSIHERPRRRPSKLAVSPLGDPTVCRIRETCALPVQPYGLRRTWRVAILALFHVSARRADVGPSVARTIDVPTIEPMPRPRAPTARR